MFINLKKFQELALFCSGEEDDTYSWKYANKIRRLRNIKWVRDITEREEIGKNFNYCTKTFIDLDIKFDYDFDPEIEFDKEALINFVVRKGKTTKDMNPKSIFDDDAPMEFQSNAYSEQL